MWARTEELQKDFNTWNGKVAFGSLPATGGAKGETRSTHAYEIHLCILKDRIFSFALSSSLLRRGTTRMCCLCSIKEHCKFIFCSVVIHRGRLRDFTYLSCTPTPQNRKAAKTCLASGLKRKVEAAKTVKVCREFLKCSPTAGCLSTWPTSCGEDQQQLPLVAILTCKTRVSL